MKKMWICCRCKKEVIVTFTGDTGKPSPMPEGWSRDRIKNYCDECLSPDDLVEMAYNGCGDH